MPSRYIMEILMRSFTKKRSLRINKTSTVKISLFNLCNFLYLARNTCFFSKSYSPRNLRVRISIPVVTPDSAPYYQELKQVSISLSSSRLASQEDTSIMWVLRGNLRSNLKQRLTSTTTWVWHHSLPSPKVSRFDFLALMPKSLNILVLTKLIPAPLSTEGSKGINCKLTFFFLSSLRELS